MKQKNFKIKNSILFVYKPAKSINHSHNGTDPTVTVLTTTVTSTGIFNVEK